MDTLTRVQIQDEIDFFSHNAKTLGKGLHPTILLPAMGKQLGRLCFLTMIWQPIQGKENSKFKPVKRFLKTGPVPSS